MTPNAGVVGEDGRHRREFVLHGMSNSDESPSFSFSHSALAANTINFDFLS